MEALPRFEGTLPASLETENQPAARFTPVSTKSARAACGFALAWRSACAGAPFGGARGSVGRLRSTPLPGTEGPLDGLFHRGLAREGIIGDGKLGRLQPLDLIAQARRLLEFQIACGCPHAFFQFGDMDAQIVSDRHGIAGEAGIHQDMVALVCRAQYVCDVLL